MVEKDPIYSLKWHIECKALKMGQKGSKGGILGCKIDLKNQFRL